MVAEGVILDYAVFGAVAQMRYTEAVMTYDADILVSVANPDAIDVLGPIYRFCEKAGFSAEGDAIRVGDWPVQLIPVFDNLTEEALDCAETDLLDGTPFKAISADYLAAIALSVGRAKDFARILALREAGAIHNERVLAIVDRHGLKDEWEQFVERFGES